MAATSDASIDRQGPSGAPARSKHPALAATRWGGAPKADSPAQDGLGGVEECPGVTLPWRENPAFPGPRGFEY